MFTLPSPTVVNGIKVSGFDPMGDQVIAAQRYLTGGASPIEVVETWGEVLSQSAFGKEFLSSLELIEEIKSFSDDLLTQWALYHGLIGKLPGAVELMEDVAWSIMRRIQAKIFTQGAVKEYDQQKAHGLRWIDLYRTFGHVLRQIVLSLPNCSIAALDYLQELELQTTLPLNDMEDNPLLDSYTLEEPVDPWDEIIDQPNDLIDDMIEHIEPMVGDRYQKPAFLGPWQHYITNREPYADKEMNSTFITANAEDFAGYDEPELADDEQNPEDLPIYMQPDGFDEDLEGLFYNGAEWNIILDAHQLRSEMFEWYEEREETMSKKMKSAFFDRMRLRMKELVMKAKNMPLDTQAFVVYKIGFKVVPAKELSMVLPNPGAVWEYINHHPDLLDEYNRTSTIDTDSENEAEIIRASASLLKQTISVFPAMGVPTDTAVWNEAYIQAIANGASFEQARDAAWAAHRLSISPIGTIAFNKTQGSFGQKWKAFHNIAMAHGDEWKIAVDFLPDGVLTANHHNPHDTYKMNWSWAAKLLEKGQLKLAESQLPDVLKVGANELTRLVAQSMALPAPTRIIAQ